MPVPSCWEAQLGPTTPLSTAWYIRSFEIPADARDGWDPFGAVVRFGAVSDRAEVWLNGVRLGAHEGGYTPFELAAGGAARAGTNELVVRVSNTAGAISRYPASDDASLAALDASADGAGIREIPIGKQTWYSSLSGIWQSVTLECRAPMALRDVSVTADVGAGRVTVAWSRTSGDVNADSLELRLRVVDADGATVGAGLVADPPLSSVVVLDVSDPRPWELDDPYLYRFECELLQAGTVIDRVDGRFGMREIGIADGNVTLNGRPRYIRGALDQDVYDGTIWVPPSRAAIETTLRKAKAMGFNLVRCHIKVPDPTYFDVADEIGLLVWAELPSWNRLTDASRERARRTLAEMVEQLRHHPSIAIWTIVNEDWGTDLVHSPEDRAWVRATYDWLKALDPTRLVVDNSACWTRDGGNFHLRTDIADYHVYFAMPEHADRWRAATETYAGRPRWLWGPDGESSPSDAAPLILSEFGNWGLPRPARDSEWWMETGPGPARADGAVGRFAAQRLTRIATDADALADATQWHQFEAMQFEVGDLCRRPSIAGYVVTELTDVFWEANGLVNLDRTAKAYDARLPDVFGGDTIFADLERWDLWGGGSLRGVLHAQLDEPLASSSLTVDWRLTSAGMAARGSVDLALSSDRRGATGVLDLPVPTPDAATEAELALELLDADGAAIARQSYRLVVAPRSARTSGFPRAVVLSADVAGSATEARLGAMGHQVAAHGEILVTARLDDDAVAFAQAGGHVVAILDGGAETGWPWVTMPSSPGDRVTATGLARPVSVQSRYLAVDPETGRSLDVSGDWISSFSWIDPVVFDALPHAPLLGFAYCDVLPDQILLGADDRSMSAEVVAGAFVGWIAEPVAFAWRFDQGRGSITVTTLHLGSDGPVAWLLFESLVQHAAAGTAPAGTAAVAALAGIAAMD
ncbi:MAG: hypothetical protein H0U52_05365 [Chloroflexi bacterium]|nr:hypothetical protein [Chloroflexota bacterium]